MFSNSKQNVYLKHNVIFRMHPSLKIMMFLFLVIVTFLPNGFLALLILLGWTLILLLLARLKLRTILKTFVIILFWIGLLFLIDWFTEQNLLNYVTYLNPNTLYWGQGLIPNTGYYWLFNYGNKQPYAINIYTVAIIPYIFAKILIVFYLLRILLNCTSQTDMNNGFYLLFYPLKFLQVPINSLSLIFSLTFNFIPSLFNEAKSIMKAQKANGIEQRNKFQAFFHKYIGIIVPLFTIAFEKAENVSNALITKGFSFKKTRVLYKKPKLHWYDYVIGLISFGLCALLIYMVACHIFFVPFATANSVVLNGISQF